ncbi:MAG: hypothetical protein KDJ15_05100 [Alphaproteobacteria bacterium]|nr:hypothetical protein [Alphaproteobacteria bacterium]
MKDDISKKHKAGFISRKKEAFLKFFRDRAGSIMPMTALVLPLVLGMTGLGVDVSMWALEKRNLQAAADAASIAAAWEIANDVEDMAETSANREAENNGYDPSMAGDLSLVIATNQDGNITVTTALEQDARVWFSRVFYDGTMRTGARATALVTDPIGDFCILSLDPTESGAVSAVGNVTVESEGCGIAINSNDDEAMDLTGVTFIDMKDINIVGDYEVGNNVTLQYETLTTGSPRTPDPYQNLEIPEYGACDENNFHASGDATLTPGVYCGGISISGNGDIALEPGVYIIDAGDFSATGGGTLVGDGVSIILTNSTGNNNQWGQFDVSGNREVTLTAPDEGEEMEGVAIYQDRNAPDGGNQCNKLIGTSAINLDGAAYFPSQCFQIGGDHSLASPGTNPCSRIIARTVKLNGNPYIANNCDGSAAKDIGQILVRLIE